MQVPLLSGMGATERADFSISYPQNLEPVPTNSGISAGYLRSAMGAVSLTTGPGVDRGGILWNGVVHRVMGTKLVTVAGALVTELGDVGGSGPVSLDYGFGRLAIRSGTSLYYWDGTSLVQVTDPDLGQCIDLAWFSGQYFSTDGSYIIATDINDPTAINPTKYGAAESDPDMVTGLLKIRNELAALGQNTIEFFNYTGGSGFPMTPNQGATIPIGCVGAGAKCLYSQSFAFVGSGRNWGLGVWLAGGGSATKLSTRVIDDFLAAEPNPSAIQLEARVSRDEERLYVHLSDKTLVYLLQASRVSGQEVWYIAKSGLGMDKPYRLRSAVFDGARQVVGDAESSALGTISEDVAEHFGEAVGWRFDTRLLYNASKSGIIHTLELVGLPGRAGGASSIFLSYTRDGETYSMEYANRTAAGGSRLKRMVFSPHKRFRHYLGLRFRGNSGSLAGFAALEAEIEGLAA